MEDKPLVAAWLHMMLASNRGNDVRLVKAIGSRAESRCRPRSVPLKSSEESSVEAEVDAGKPVNMWLPATDQMLAADHDSHAS